MPFLNPNFFYDHIVSHHGHFHLFFQKFIEFFENITHCHLTSPGAVWFCFSQGRFFQGKTYLGVPYWFSQNFLQKFFRIFLKKSHLGLKKNIMKEKSEKKLKIFFCNILFFRFFPLVPQGRFFPALYGFFFRFFFHYKLNCELWFFFNPMWDFIKNKSEKILKKILRKSIGGTLTWKNLPWGTKGKNLRIFFFKIFFFQKFFFDHHTLKIHTIPGDHVTTRDWNSIQYLVVLKKIPKFFFFSNFFFKTFFSQ